LSRILGDDEEVLKIEDRTVEFLVSVAKVLLNTGFNIKLCFYRNEQICLTYSGNNGFMQLYDLLSLIPFDQVAHFSEILNMFIESIPERQSVLVFSPLIDDKQLDSFHKMAANGHDVTLFYCDVEESELKTDIMNAIEKEFPELGIRTVNLMKSSPVTEKFRVFEGEGAV